MAVMPSRPRIFHNPSVNPNYDDTVLTILSLRQVHRPDLMHASSVGLGVSAGLFFLVPA